MKPVLILLTLAVSLFPKIVFSADSSSLDIFASTPVVAIETDAYAGIAKIEITQDSHGLINGLIFRAVDGSAVLLSLAQMYQEPQILTTMSGLSETLIGLENDFEPQTGGHGIIRFLTNKTNKSYSNFRFLLYFEGTHLALKSEPNLADPESDRNVYVNKFNHLLMKAKMLLGMKTGIETVTPSLL